VGRDTPPLGLRDQLRVSHDVVRKNVLYPALCFVGALGLDNDNASLAYLAPLPAVCIEELLRRLDARLLVKGSHRLLDFSAADWNSEARHVGEPRHVGNTTAALGRLAAPGPEAAREERRAGTTSLVSFYRAIAAEMRAAGAERVAELPRYLLQATSRKVYAELKEGK
jgi:hypothetical protein